MACCNNNVWSCSNPCATSAANTAACETLPSALDNFIRHFFGAVIKTEVNGQVTWSLPCGLDVGLPNNPRSIDEGLSCYFLRLFNDGIVGLTGPVGPSGTNGSDGRHAFTVTIESFTQPTVGASINVRIYANPVFSPGAVVFISSSGWYEIQAVSSDGSLVLTLLQAVSGATGLMTAGKLVVMSGPQGLTGVAGAAGAAGPVGPTGPAGVAHTTTNGFVKCAGTDFILHVAPVAQVTFAPGVEPELTLPTPGEYLVDYIVGVTMDPTAASPTPEIINVQIWNATTAAFETDLDQTVRCFLPNERGQIVGQAIITTTVPNETLQLYADISVDHKAVIVPARTSLRYVRLS